MRNIVEPGQIAKSSVYHSADRVFYPPPATRVPEPETRAELKEAQKLLWEARVKQALLSVGRAEARTGAAEAAAEQSLRQVEIVEERLAQAELRAQCAEAQFIQAQKMEVVGHLAAGVAHDFNNILGVIMGHIELLALRLPTDGPLSIHTGEIRHALERAVGLTGQLLVFSSKQSVEVADLDLNQTIHDLEHILRRLIDERIALTIATDPAIGYVKANSGHLGQVLMNLVVNARDAMPAGGLLEIRTSNLTLPADPAHSVNAGDYVCLRVSDNGCGMTPEVQQRLFEAFFTTKPPGKGTGLGMTTCNTIIQQCGGHIRVASEPGLGSTFEIYLPRRERLQQSERPAARATAPRAMARGSETILVVEDEPAIRTLLCQILQAQGYQVLSASNGLEALELSNSNVAARIRLLVTDLVMPNMGGHALAEQLRGSDPGLKVLFTSGYFALDRQFEGNPRDNGFLPKPYDPVAFTEKIRGLLDG